MPAGLHYGVLLRGWILLAIGWVFMGASLWAVLRAMGTPADLADLHLYTAAIAMAVVGGFLSMIPGGLLTREAILGALLVHQLGDVASALVAVALLRLVWLVAEVLISAILYVGGRVHAFDCHPGLQRGR